MYTLRKYQREAVKAGVQCLKSGKNGILVLPTGSGKSIIIAKLAEEMGGKGLILQPTKEILEQNRDKLRAVGCRNLGVYSASVGCKYVGTITLATIGSIVKKGFLFKGIDWIVIDESHKVNSKAGMYSKLLDELGSPVLGLTATPYRMKTYRDFHTQRFIAESRILTRTRPRIFSKIVHVTQVGELFDADYLCPLEYENENDYDSSKIKSTSTGQGFDDSALKTYNLKQSITEKIVSAIAATDKNHYLIFTEFTSESKCVIEGLAEHGIKCIEVSAKTKKKDRESILCNFKAGRIRAVVNVGVLTTGFDFPELDCIILGSPGKSVAQYYQKTGRGIRIAPGKASCLLVDLCDNVKRFGKIETFELYDQNGKGMWRLRSDVGNLTGVDVVTGKNLEKIKGGPEKNEKGEQMVTFGRHAGMRLCDVPLSWLNWCVANFKDGKQKTMLCDEFDRRESEVLV